MSWFGKVFPTEFGSTDIWAGLLNTLFGTAVDTDTRIQIAIPLRPVKNGTYPILINTRFPYTVEDATYVTDAGTCTVAVQINNSNVGGLSALSVTSTEGTAAATGDNTAVAGDDLKVVVSDATGATQLTLNIWINRTGSGTA
jgi:hypothetical protein